MSSEKGAGATEYVGALAVVALIVAAVATAGGVPRGIATAMERQVCRIVGGAGCPSVAAEEGAEQGADAAAAAAPRWRLAYYDPGDDEPLRVGYGVPATWLEPRDGGPESDGWMNCPPGYVCLYGDDNYQREIYRYRVANGDDEVDLPAGARDIALSWVNNSAYDLCTSDSVRFAPDDEQSMPGSTHTYGRNRNADAGLGVDRIGSCDHTYNDPDPLLPPEQGGPDCPEEFVCLYDDPNFGNELFRVPVGPGMDKVDLPPDVRDRVSSWANPSGYDVCGYEEVDGWFDNAMTMSVRNYPYRWRTEDGTHDHAVQAGALPADFDNTFDHIDAC
jgi:hypothetical protein